MKPLKYSRQREAIQEYLQSTTAHPTADIVYENVRKEFPQISLGTVYRNLNLLVSIDEAIKIASKDGSDRFDARVSPHYHFVCSECGCVKDIPMSLLSGVEEEANDFTQDIIMGHEIMFRGICQNCYEEKQATL